MHPNSLPLHNGQPGLRTLLPIEIREPAPEVRADSCGSDPSGPSDPCLDFISSTPTLDRYHEIIDPAGWRLETYRRNPVFQNAHNYGDVLFTLGKALITEVRGAPGSTSDNSHSTLRGPHLYQRIQFATNVNPVARIAYGLYKGKFLNAVSVGFIPLRWEDGPNAECGVRGAELGNGRPSAGLGTRNVELDTPGVELGENNSEGPSPIPHSALRIPQSALHRALRSAPNCRRRYLEQELFEVSAVAIPANPDALALGLKSGAIIKADLADTLDLLRCLAGPGNKPNLQPANCNLQPFLVFARQLHRILRHA